jgi:uncharacterized protein YdiU (UPF0061 family)
MPTGTNPTSRSGISAGWPRSLLGPDEDAAIASAKESLGAFSPRFKAAYDAGLRRKIGLVGDSEADTALTQDLLRMMAENGADFTLTFRSLSEGDDGATRVLFADASAYDTWADRWRRHLEEKGTEPDLRREAMRAVNPAYIPRNHMVERVIQAAVASDDFGPFEALLNVLSRPFDAQPGREIYALPPARNERVLQTFCGT